MAAELRLEGVPASGGLAAGPAFHLRRTAAAARAPGSPEAEASALQAALDAAEAAIGALAGDDDTEAADILEFQQALIADDDLTEPVFAAIAAGAPADRAWREALDAEIADYAAAPDAYMAARASDLRDLRDRVLAHLRGDPIAAPAPPAGAIVLADDLTPTGFLELDWRRLGGAALAAGSPTSHVAILARARGTPLITGCAGIAEIPDGEALLLDAAAGTLVHAPERLTVADFSARRVAAGAEARRTGAAALQPAATADGTPVRVLINVDDPGVLEGLSPEICDGIGLTRSEFLFHGGAPDEEHQVAAYASIVGWADGRPVTIRTLDAGGDKPIPGVTVDGEANPFLGVRGLRLSLARPEIFRVQLRALARAAVRGPLKIMLPMVSDPAELEAARAALDAAVAELARENRQHARPQLGIMVETPAAALRAGDFEAAFFSIGSNDLTQYVMAAARDNPAVAPLARPDHPAVLELIERTVEVGATRSVDVSLCGDMASQPGMVATLVGLGLRIFSVAPAQVGAVKAAIAQVRVA